MDRAGNTQSNGDEKSPLPSIELPKGGGAIRDIGEKFQADGPTGAGSLAIPLPFSLGAFGIRTQAEPAVRFRFRRRQVRIWMEPGLIDHHRENGQRLASLSRRGRSDVFILSGAEDLVPLLDGSGNRVRSNRTVHGIAYQICWYRPRIEGLFARIERWFAIATGISHWRCITRDNVTTLYGLDATGCVTDPSDPRKIFSYQQR
jgi:hypothetical protein